MIDTKHCLCCKKRNPTLYWHVDPDTNEYWCWCNSCDRGYSIRSYCFNAGISLTDFLKNDFDLQETTHNEVQVMEWPANFVPLSDPRAHPAVDYLASRGLTPEGDMYYDMERNGIVFPMYFLNHFCGAQIRFIVPRVHPDGDVQKMDTLSGTRLGNLFGLWNQGKFMGNVKAVIICEGALNAISINQALNQRYGGIANNPWRAISCSGCGATQHHRETIKELKDQGIKTICAFDNDEAGMKGLKKFKDSEALTHYALTEDTRDWNDILQTMTKPEFAKFFLSKVKKI